MVTMKALKNFPYGGKTRPVGSTYDVRPEHVALLERTGMAERYVAPAKRSYRRRDMVPEAPRTMTAETTTTTDEDPGPGDQPGEKSAIESE